jgi:hypothetical protein
MHFYNNAVNKITAADTMHSNTFHHTFFIFMLLLPEGRAGKPRDMLTK